MTLSERTPPGWEKNQLGNLMAHVIDFRGRTPKKLGMAWGSGAIPALSANNVKMGEVNLSEPTFYGSEMLYTRWMTSGPAQKGDVLITMEAPLGNVAQVPDAKRYILSQRVVLLRFHDEKMNNSFAAHQLRSERVQKNLERWSTGTTATGIQRARLVRVPLFVPPLPEQQRIAEILETIDDAIRKTEQIIAKLKQMKQGLLHDLLTRGIDGNGELRDADRDPEQFKDSALGRIPKVWDVTRLGDLLESIDAGKSPNCPNRPATGDEWGVLKVSAVRPSGFQPNENKAITNPTNIEPTYEVRDGDLLITRANTYELVGLTCLVQSPPPRLLLCDKTLRLNLAGRTDHRFIFYTSQMPYVRSQIEIHATGSSDSMKNIGQKAIKRLLLRVAPYAEQTAIAEVLDSHDLRINREERQVSKLHLLKQGLMEDLLTGRVRVTKLLENEANE
jgi:type I restriction enzyme, S subunit